MTPGLGGSTWSANGVVMTASGGQDRLRGGGDHVGRSVSPPQPLHTRLHLLTTAPPPATSADPRLSAGNTSSKCEGMVCYCV